MSSLLQGLEVPVVVAPMAGGASTPELVAAVSAPLYSALASRVRLATFLPWVYAAIALSLLAFYGLFWLHYNDPANWKLAATCEKKDPPACDQNVPTALGAVDTPPFPWQNRGTYHQVVEMSGHR